MARMEISESRSVYQLFVKQLNGQTLTLRFTTPSLSGQALIDRIQSRAGLPRRNDHLLLLSEGRLLSPDSLIVADQARLFPSVTLSCRLLGGKGGFGSLLRGAATKAGQKKTNNFDACRDMSGRRLRHVNAEKRLEEWKEGEEERQLEKVAEEFLKRKAKTSKGSVKGDSSEKYVAKYREESAKCVAEVESAVREAFERKRKGISPETVDAKKLKIWLGKKKIDETDDMEEDDDDDYDSSDEEEGKSTVTNNQQSLSENDQGSLSPASDGKVGGDSSGGVSCEESSQDGNHKPSLESSESGHSSFAGVEVNCIVEPPELMDQTYHTEAHPDEPKGKDMQALESEVAGSSSKVEIVQADGYSGIKLENVKTSASEEEEPLNFDNYDTAADMEVLGMDRLKSELQSRGIKCGGTLQERAARLFLLKTISVDKLPKKLLVKK